MNVVAILYNIRSVHNVGSIFRTADAAGIKKIFVCGITPTPLDRFKKKRQDFTKASLGAEDSVAWEQTGHSVADSLESTSVLIQQLHKDDWDIAAVEQNTASIPYDAYRPKHKKVALLMGNEVEGVPHELLNLSDVILEIPMHGTKESLNVSVAFGIVAYGIKKTP